LAKRQWIYLVVDQLPAEFGEWRIISAHTTLRGANGKMRELKGHNLDSYSMQYVRIIRRELSE
jgi:hypothetical protein